MIRRWILRVCTSDKSSSICDQCERAAWVRVEPLKFSEASATSLPAAFLLVELLAGLLGFDAAPFPLLLAAFAAVAVEVVLVEAADSATADVELFHDIVLAQWVGAYHQQRMYLRHGAVNTPV